jgi:hypothetical protein
MAAVVINEFEVLSESRGVQRAAEPSPGADEGAAPPALEAHDVNPALRQLEAQALRVWAH